MGTQSLVSYTYGSYNGDLTQTTYGNGQYLTPTYDSLGRIIRLSYNGTAVYEYCYGTNGKVGLEKDLTAGISWRYGYDQAGRVINLTGSNHERHYYTYSGTTGELVGNLTCSAQRTTNIQSAYTYGFYNGVSGERMLKQIAIHANRVKVQYTYDDFYRAGKTVLLNTGLSLNTACIWRAGSGANHTSYMPSGQTETVKDANGNTLVTKALNYTYDVLGNIETVKEGTTQRQKYYYDSLNQLTREDNAELNKTFVYSYDLGGNLTSTQEYAYQTGSSVSGTPLVFTRK